MLLPHTNNRSIEGLVLRQIEMLNSRLLRLPLGFLRGLALDDKRLDNCHGVDRIFRDPWINVVNIIYYRNHLIKIQVVMMQKVHVDGEYTDSCGGLSGQNTTLSKLR